jgi:hypothetical protein
MTGRGVGMDGIEDMEDIGSAPVLPNPVLESGGVIVMDIGSTPVLPEPVLELEGDIIMSMGSAHSARP